MIKAVLMDIEGTTTSISFVHDVLFPYSKKHLPQFIREHEKTPEVRQYLEMARKDEEAGDQTLEDVIKLLTDWIDADRKHPALKGLQGLIWEDGYRQQQYTSHVYDDVPPALNKWQQSGLVLAIYSSGSVKAQKLLFGHTSFGDLNKLFSGYFDTAVGGKREASSYTAIARQLNLQPEQILFLSDIAEELDAAKKVGMRTIQLLRPGTKNSGRHDTATDFSVVTISASNSV